MKPKAGMKGGPKVPGSGGSRKGKPNKATKALKDMILGALDRAGGESYLLEQARNNPAAFLTLIGKVLPQTLNATVAATLTSRTVEVPADE